MSFNSLTCFLIYLFSTHLEIVINKEGFMGLEENKLKEEQFLKIIEYVIALTGIEKYNIIAL